MADEYKIYRGESIDEMTYLQSVAAGVAELSVAQANGTVRWYGVAPVSAAGVEGPMVVRRVERTAAGDVIAAMPNALTAARAEPAAGGKLTVHIAYSRTGEESSAKATGVQIALEDAAGEPDWASPLATLTIPPNCRIIETLDTVFADGATLRLRARAVTAEGLAGPAQRMEFVVADATAPGDVIMLEATQYDS